SVAQLFDGEGRIGVEFPVALFARRPGGADQRGGVVEFGHHAVDRLIHPRESSLILACGKRVRTSKIEIIGRRRMNSINRTRNSPMVPRYVDRLIHPRESSLILACGKRVRTSKIEIIGRRRMNSINRTRNSPMVPRY